MTTKKPTIEKKTTNPLGELLDIGKQFFAELPKAIEELKEQGIGALAASDAEPGMLPQEIRIRFRRNDAGELVPALDGEKGAEKIGTYRLTGEAEIPAEEPPSEGEAPDTERPPA